MMLLPLPSPRFWYTPPHASLAFILFGTRSCRLFRTQNADRTPWPDLTHSPTKPQRRLYRDRRTLPLPRSFAPEEETEERETTLHIANETPRNKLQSGTLPTAASYQTKHYVHTVIEDKKQNHFYARVLYALKSRSRKEFGCNKRGLQSAMSARNQ